MPVQVYAAGRPEHHRRVAGKDRNSSIGPVSESLHYRVLGPLERRGLPEPRQWRPCFKLGRLPGAPALSGPG